MKGYPFEVAIPHGLEVSGVILSDQVKSMDWRQRNAEIVARLPSPAFEEVLTNIRALLFLG